MISPKTVILITGPTASGKTDLALEAAAHFNTKIISADSRQCFRELNIGVAKPSPAQLSAVPHYFVNSHSIHETVNAALFASLALQWCEEVFAENDHVVLCGGTGLYLKAFVEGLDAIPIVGEALRNEILNKYRENGIGWLQEAVRSADPLFYSAGEIQNPQRLMRALEVMQGTGRSIVSFRTTQQQIRPFRILQFALEMPREILYARINQRTENMMDAGLLEEVAALVPYQHLNALQTVGYSELFDYLNGKTSLEEGVSLIKQHTRHYAKRQLTWLRKNEKLVWLQTDFLQAIVRADESKT